MLVFVFVCVAVAIAYGIVAGRSVWTASAGSERMQEIAGAIQEGAGAYLNRQYTAIAIVGAVIAVILYFLLGWQVAAAYVVGAVLSGATGYIGMHRLGSGERPDHGSRPDRVGGRAAVSFKAGSVTGMLVAGLALFAVAGTYWFLLSDGASGRALVDPLVGLGFGASLISIFARLGGGIFTKGADVGADLVGKVEAGIPEDDPRNPAVSPTTWATMSVTAPAWRRICSRPMSCPLWRPWCWHRSCSLDRRSPDR